MTTDPFAPKAGVPVSIMKGRFTAWYISSDVDAATITLKTVFISGGAKIEFDGVPDNGKWTFTASSGDTETLTSGVNTVDVVAVRNADDQETVLASTTCNVFVDTEDRRSHASIMLQKIESILQGRADADVESYTIKSRSISKMSIPDLIMWRDYYLAELGREPGRSRQAKTVHVGFK